MQGSYPVWHHEEDMAIEFIRCCFLELLDVTLFQGADGLLILLFDFSEGLVPSLVELLILHKVSLFYFFTFSCLIVD